MLECYQKNQHAVCRMHSYLCLIPCADSQNNLGLSVKLAHMIKAHMG